MRITNAIITTIINNTFILFVYWSVLAKGVAPLMWRFPISPLPGDSIASDLSIIVGYPQANWVGQWTNLRPTSEKNQCKILASSRYLGGLPPFPRFTSKGLRLACIDDIGIAITDWLQYHIDTFISTLGIYGNPSCIFGN